MSQELNNVKESVIVCTDCKLCNTRTNSVPGKGSFQSDVMFVGEAPGKNEDHRGEPFVGAAGKKLSIALEAAGIERETVYITNVVKCRPPNNRVPNELERQKCKKYLEMEISIIKPKVICILGNTAFGSILGGSEIKKFRGKIVQKDNKIYFLTIHPAATIYNQELIEVLKKDIIKLFETVTELKKGKQIPIDIEYTS